MSKETRNKPPQLPLENEVGKDLKFKHKTGLKEFKGQKLPGHSTIFFDDNYVPANGEIIGRTRFESHLVWFEESTTEGGIKTDAHVLEVSSNSPLWTSSLSEDGRRILKRSFNYYFPDLDADF